jgi:hypothetical protein
MVTDKLALQSSTSKWYTGAKKVIEAFWRNQHKIKIMTDDEQLNIRKVQLAFGPAKLKYYKYFVYSVYK